MPADRIVTARFHGGPMAGPPTFVVVHDAETPLVDSYVQSIAEWFARGPAAGTSAHHMTGPRSWVQMLPEDVVAYAAGPKANPRGIHVEQTGYARFSRAEWTSPDGMSLHATTARCAREACDRWGIPKRWATDAQLRAAAAGQAGSGGLVTHATVTRVLGGTTHDDPGLSYPGDLLMAAVLGGGGGDMAELTGESLRLLKDVQSRVRGGRANLDQLQAIEYLVTKVQDTLDGSSPQDGDRLGDLWNQGGAILAALQGMQKQLDAIVAKVGA